MLSGHPREYGKGKDYTRDGAIPIEQAAKEATRSAKKAILDSQTYFNLPVYLTETSAGLTDEAKVAYIKALFQMTRDLRAQGVPFVGMNWWPLFDTIQWDYRENARQAAGRLHLFRRLEQRPLRHQAATRWRPQARADRGPDDVPRPDPKRSGSTEQGTAVKSIAAIVVLLATAMAQPPPGLQEQPASFCVDPATTYQTIEGFGAGFFPPSLWAMTDLRPEELERMYDLLYTDKGVRLNILGFTFRPTRSR